MATTGTAARSLHDGSAGKLASGHAATPILAGFAGFMALEDFQWFKMQTGEEVSVKMDFA